MGITEGEVQKSFWHGKKVFLTGHTGFKGSWLSIWLHSMGADVKGYSLEPNTMPNLFTEARVDDSINSEIGDIRNLKQISKSMLDFNPDVLIHMAAQPLVRLSYQEPVDTYTTNIIGTVNVLEAARNCKKLKAIVSVTTDKCYENREQGWGYRESDPMGGHDPYSSSKGCAELVTSAYRRSFFNLKDTASLATARAGNVIGGGDWSEDRLIPDILKSFDKTKPVIIRNPNSIRPWQHVLEPLSGYLVLAQQLYIRGQEFAEAWNFGPKDEDCKSVGWITDEIKKLWKNDVKWILDDKTNLHEAQLLKLDCTKAANRLNWKPKWNISQAISCIIEWHRIYLSNGDLREQCIKEIKKYNG